MDSENRLGRRLTNLKPRNKADVNKNKLDALKNRTSKIILANYNIINKYAKEQVI